MRLLSTRNGFHALVRTTEMIANTKRSFLVLANSTVLLVSHVY